MVKKNIWINRMTIVAFIFAMALFGAFASNVSAEENLTIEVIKDGKSIELERKPFITNNTIYLPLREMLLMENVKNDDITYDNGCIQFLIYANESGSIVYRGEKYDFWVNRVRLNNSAIYIAGHSYGSTENDVLINAPVLTGDVTYVPYEMFQKLSASGQGVFDNLSVNVYDDNGNVPQLSGVGYRNEDLNFSVDIPLRWSGKYEIIDNADFISFVQKSTYRKYGVGTGTLFYIERLEQDKTQEEILLPGNREIIMNENGYVYVLGRPTDVQYPIWTDHDEEDFKIASEYEEMLKDMEYIGDSIEPIYRVIR